MRLASGTIGTPRADRLWGWLQRLEDHDDVADLLPMIGADPNALEPVGVSVP